MFSLTRLFPDNSSDISPTAIKFRDISRQVVTRYYLHSSSPPSISHGPCPLPMSHLCQLLCFFCQAFFTTTLPEGELLKIATAILFHTHHHQHCRIIQGSEKPVFKSPTHQVFLGFIGFWALLGFQIFFI